jgi:hypothetical protein
MISFRYSSPSRRLCELVPETSASMPSFKIIRRNTPKGRNTSHERYTQSAPSSTGTDLPIAIVRSDAPSPDVAVDGSETVEDDREVVLRSLGLPSNPAKTSSGTIAPRKTMQEREAEYAEARSRIFQDFAEKEKEAARLRTDRERERALTEMHREVSILDAPPSLDPGLVAYPSLYDADTVQDASQPTTAPLYTAEPYAPQYAPMIFNPNNPYANRYPIPLDPMQMGYPPYPPLGNQPGPPHRSSQLQPFGKLGNEQVVCRDELSMRVDG